ncbi:hypothetical protein FRC10_006444 [Ceratobasidium sp. 414]|nr:hypothetical protein FRC10_006444 [Ceratobasidium sp. 414]
MAPRKFEPVDIEDVLSKLTLNEKTRLLAGAHVLLGPTVNIQRSPLGGRGFEAYSEDPLLSGLTARAFIKGVQSEGVAATIKHYACNDSEFERTSMSSEVSTRALREIYLRPFELACRNVESPAWAIMAGYNRVNGLHASENELYGTYSADASIKAGLDLEMPVLKFINKVAASGVPENAEETGNPSEEMVALLRESAGNANVLLKNDADLLPLPLSLKSVAVIGPNADAPVYSGGGSANLRPYTHTTALEGIRAALPGAARVQHVSGVLAHKETPLLGHKHLKTRDGKPGFDIDWFHEDPLKNPQAERVHHTIGTNSACWFVDNLPEYEFGAMADGLIDMYVNGVKIIDNSTNPVPGPGFFGTASCEVLGTTTLEAHKPAQLVVQYASSPIAHSRGYSRTNLDAIPEIRGSCRFGGGRVFSEDEGIQEAVDAAKQANAVVLVIGLNNDWETESQDRANMSLPGATDRLVSAVLAANKRTALVVISGTPVSMPWAAPASTIVQSFYSGGEAGNGMADTLFGKINPSSKLPLTFPIRDEDAPSYFNFPGQNGKVFYSEGVFVGYRHYQAHKKDVLFPFGFGLSYTQFEYSSTPLSGKIGAGSVVVITVIVKNIGKYAGREVVQIYVKDPVSRLDRPIKELKGYSKTSLIKPGGTDMVEIALDPYAFAYFDDWAGDGQDGKGRWVAEAGEFEVIVAASSVDERARVGISLEKSFDWV